jgi:chromosome segregation ATPase
MDGIDSIRTDIHFVSEGIGLLSAEIENAVNRIRDLGLSTEELNSTINRIHQSNLVIEERLNDVIMNLTELSDFLNRSLPYETNLSGLLEELETIKMMIDRMDLNVTIDTGSLSEFETLLEEYESISEEINRLLNDNEQLDRLETELEGLEKDNKDTRDLVESGNLILYIVILVLFINIILLGILLIRTGKKKTMDDQE